MLGLILIIAMIIRDFTEQKRFKKIIKYGRDGYIAGRSQNETLHTRTDTDRIL